MKPQPGMMRTFVSSGVSGTISQVITAASSLISFPIIVISLGKLEYGIWILVGNSLMFLAMSDFGIINSVGRLVAKYKSNIDKTDLTKVINTVFSLLVLSGVVIGIGTIALTPWIPQILNIPLENHKITQQIFTLGGLLLAVTLPLRAGTGFLSGYQKYSLINYTQAAMSVVNLALIIFLSAIDQLGLLELAILYSLSSLLVEGIRFFLSLKYTETKLSPIYLSKRFMMEIFDLASSSITTTLTAFGYRQGIVIAIAHFLSVSEAGVFGICLVIMNSISKLLSQIAVPIATLVSEHSEKKSLKSIRYMNNAYISITFGLGLCILSGIIAYADVILTLLFSKSDWQNRDYLICYTSLIIMSSCITIGMPQIGSRAVLQGGGQHWYVARATLFGSIASIIIAVIMMNHIGLYGAAIGWSTTWILQGIFFYPKAIKKRLNQNYLSMIKDGYLPGLYCGTVVALYLWGISHWITPSDIIQLITSICITGILAIGFLYLRLKPKKSTNHLK